MYRRFGLRLHTPLPFCGEDRHNVFSPHPSLLAFLHLHLFHISCDHAMYRMTLSKTAAGKARPVLSPQL